MWLICALCTLLETGLAPFPIFRMLTFGPRYCLLFFLLCTSILLSWLLFLCDCSQARCFLCSWHSAACVGLCALLTRCLVAHWLCVHLSPYSGPTHERHHRALAVYLPNKTTSFQSCARARGACTFFVFILHVSYIRS